MLLAEAMAVTKENKKGLSAGSRIGQALGLFIDFTVITLMFERIRLSIIVSRDIASVKRYTNQFEKQDEYDAYLHKLVDDANAGKDILSELATLKMHRPTRPRKMYLI